MERFHSSEEDHQQPHIADIPLTETEADNDFVSDWEGWERLDWDCVVAYVIAGLTVKSKTQDLHFVVMSDSHPADEGADCVDTEEDIPSWMRLIGE